MYTYTVYTIGYRRHIHDRNVLSFSDLSVSIEKYIWWIKIRIHRDELQFMAVLKMILCVFEVVCLCVNPTEIKMSVCILIESSVGELFNMSVP